MRRAVSLAAIALPLLLLSSPGAAYELLRVRNNPCSGDQNLFWAEAAANVSTVNLPSPVRGLADEARLRWNASVGRFNFYASTIGIGQSVCRRDGTTSMVVSSSSCDGSSLGDALAVTRSVWNSDGTLVDADVVFNAQSRVMSSDAVFLEVAMHELGHVLGLDHSDACGQSGSGTLMRSVLVFGAPRLEAPQADDVAGAESIYPSGGGEPAENTGSCAVTEASAVSWTALPWSLVGIVLAIRFFRSQRSP
jgi:hypothetical protein